MNDFTKEELQELRDFLDPESDWYRLTDFQCSIRDKLQYMIDNYQNPTIDYGHLNDKHIGQWAGYLIEEYPRWRELEKTLADNPEIDEVFLEMYKKGFQDCKTEGGMKS